MPNDTERELRSGRYKGVRVPSSYQPVDDPHLASRLQDWQQGVDSALDNLQASVDRVVASIRKEATMHAVPGSVTEVPLRIEQRRCRRSHCFGSHYWYAGPPDSDQPQSYYCPGPGEL